MCLWTIFLYIILNISLSPSLSLCLLISFMAVSFDKKNDSRTVTDTCETRRTLAQTETVTNVDVLQSLLSSRRLPVFGQHWNFSFSGIWHPWIACSPDGCCTIPVNQPAAPCPTSANARPLKHPPSGEVVVLFPPSVCPSGATVNRTLSRPLVDVLRKNSARLSVTPTTIRTETADQWARIVVPARWNQMRPG